MGVSKVLKTLTDAIPVLSLPHPHPHFFRRMRRLRMSSAGQVQALEGPPGFRSWSPEVSSKSLDEEPRSRVNMTPRGQRFESIRDTEAPDGGRPELRRKVAGATGHVCSQRGRVF